MPLHVSTMPCYTLHMTDAIFFVQTTCPAHAQHPKANDCGIPISCVQTLAAVCTSATAFPVTHWHLTPHCSWCVLAHNIPICTASMHPVVAGAHHGNTSIHLHRSFGRTDGHELVFCCGNNSQGRAQSAFQLPIDGMPFCAMSHDCFQADPSFPAAPPALHMQ